MRKKENGQKEILTFSEVNSSSPSQIANAIRSSLTLLEANPEVMNDEVLLYLLCQTKDYIWYKYRV